MNAASRSHIKLYLIACASLPSCTSLPPNYPLPKSWYTPRPAAVVINDAIPLPLNDTNELITEINSKLKKKYGAGDHLEYEMISYEDGHLKLSVTEGLHTVYGVELYRLFGRWRVGKTDVFLE